MLVFVSNKKTNSFIQFTDIMMNSQHNLLIIGNALVKKKNTEY